MAIRVCPLCQAEFLEFKTVCSHCDVALLDPDDDVDPRQLGEDEQVIYELGGWPIDAQGDAAQLMAESGVPHAWMGTDVVIPALHERAIDRLLERVEKDYGLDSESDDDDGVVGGDEGDLSGETEYDLGTWEASRRMELVEKLVFLKVPHRWEEALLLVPTTLEDTVDDVLDEVEGLAGVVLDSDMDGDGESGEPFDSAEILSALFLAGERMRKGKVDVDRYGALLDALEVSDPEHPPFGFEPAVWEKALELGEDLADAVAEETDELEQVADELYRLLRPFI